MFAILRFTGLAPKLPLGAVNTKKDALQAYETQMSASHKGLRISSCGFFVSVKQPFLGASPDALINCTCCGQGIIEIKCPFCASETSLQEAADRGKHFCLNELPDRKFQLRRDHGYYYQCQIQMFVTGRLFCDFVVWTPRDIYIERITFDKELIQTIVPTAKKFWKLCVLPEPLGKWYTRQQCPDSYETSFHTQTEEEDSGKWCYCREDRGEEKIGCDGSQIQGTSKDVGNDLAVENKTVSHKWACYYATLK